MSGLAGPYPGGRLLAAIILGGISVAGCRPEASPTPTTLEFGEATYNRFCAVCHGLDGKAMTETDSPQLNNPTFLASADDDFLTANIAQGRPGTKMSAFGQAHRGPLEDAEVSAIVAYLRSWTPADAPTPEPFVAEGIAANGRLLYEEQCAECHGGDGRSLTAPDLSNPVFLDTASDAFIRHAVLHGRPGTKMEAFDLKDDQIADIISYVRTLGD